MLAKRQAESAFDDLESRLGRGEEHLAPRAADPERPRDAARQLELRRRRARRSRPRHRALELLERGVIGTGRLHEGEDRLRVDGHLRLGPGEAVAVEDLLVVDDDPVVDADHRSVPDRMVVGDDRRDGPSCSRERGRGPGWRRPAARERRGGRWHRIAACGSRPAGPRLGGRSRRRRHRARRCRPAAPARQASDRRRSRRPSCIPRYRTSGDSITSIGHLRSDGIGRR